MNPIFLTLSVYASIALILAFLWFMTSRKKVMNNESIDEPEQTDGLYFPEWYSRAYVGCVIFMIVAFLAFMGGITYFLFVAQKMLYFRSDDIYYSNVLIAAVPALFLGIALSSLLLKILTATFFPKFDKYQSARDEVSPLMTGFDPELQKQAWDEVMQKIKLKQIDLKQKARDQWRVGYKILFFFWIFTGVVFIFSLDAYTKISDTGISENSFFSLKEKKYNWNEINTALFSVQTSERKQNFGMPQLYFRFVVSFKDGNSVDLYNIDPVGMDKLEATKKFIDLARKNNVDVQLQQLTEEQKNILLYSKENPYYGARDIANYLNP